MKINAVAQITGLSKKAIRLYEAKGLLKIQRKSNGYRDYTEFDIEFLKRIKLLRLAGVSVSDIKLLGDKVISMEEILEKRKNEIDMENGKHSDQYSFCNMIITKLRDGEFDCKYNLEETEETIDEKHGALAVGIDIGTTAIAATVIDLTYKRQVEVYNIVHHFQLDSAEPYFAEQDADGILNRCFKLLDHIINSYSGIISIGVTGQMHGIVYINAEGKAVSPLITWQDKRADCVIAKKETYCDRIKHLTGETVATGFGFATHYYNVISGLVPKTAIGFCSIMDYIVMRLTEKKTPLVHSSVAASFGLFDIRRCCFMDNKIKVLSMENITLPNVTENSSLYGEYKSIPVSVAIGDNQASLFGSVKNIDNSVLINIGTGSQISMISNKIATEDTVELRPLIKNKYIVCGSALCGGSAYAMLERFFRKYAVTIGAEDKPQYEVMNQIAEEAYEKKISPMTVDTSFGGTRNDPTRRGRITDVNEMNFSPASLILGFINGMCRELYSLFLAANSDEKKEVVVSGGAVRNNRVLRRMISDVFKMPVSLNDNIEEASVGAALFSALAVGYLKSTDDFSDFIHYKNYEKEEA